MSLKKKEIASVQLFRDRPTKLRYDDLYTWVIWQFPKKKGSGLCGAVRPPIANDYWYPALLNSTSQQLLVYANLNIRFSSPSAAADWLAATKD